MYLIPGRRVVRQAHDEGGLVLRQTQDEEMGGGADIVILLCILSFNSGVEISPTEFIGVEAFGCPSRMRVCDKMNRYPADFVISTNALGNEIDLYAT